MPHDSQYPLVSIVMPTHNRSLLLRRAVSSILEQTFTNFELIIVDDCSDDDTEHQVSTVDDHRIIYLKSESRVGAAAARNIAIKSARGRYIAFLDSDDEYLHNKLELQVNKFEEAPANIGIIYCGYYIAYESNHYYEVVPPEYKGNLFDILLKHNRIGSPTPLVRKECFNSCGLFDESLPSCQDWDMWLRISTKYDFDFVNEPLAKVHNHGNQISTNIDNKILSREKLLEKYKSCTAEKPKTASYLYQRLGFLHLLKHNQKTGIKYYLKSIASNPADLKSYAILLTSLISWKLHLRLMRGDSIREINGITIYF